MFQRSYGTKIDKRHTRWHPFALENKFKPKLRGGGRRAGVKISKLLASGVFLFVSNNLEFIWKIFFQHFFSKTKNDFMYNFESFSVSVCMCMC